MHINKAIFLISFLVGAMQASQELEKMIVKTDLEAIKKILPTITLNPETKQRLIDLANDIMLMRLKTVEIYSCKHISHAEYKNLKKSLSQKTIGEIKKLCEPNKWTTISLYSFPILLISFFIAINSESTKAAPVVMSCLIGSFIGLFCFTINIANTTDSVQTKIRSNLQELYQDSIEIKHLVANVAI